MAQACTHDGPVVNCDDGRRGMLSGDAISGPTARDRASRRIPASSSATNRRCVVGQGVFVGKGKGVVPLDDPNAPNKTRCAMLDGVSYCN